MVIDINIDIHTDNIYSMWALLRLFFLNLLKAQQQQIRKLMINQSLPWHRLFLLVISWVFLSIWKYENYFETEICIFDVSTYIFYQKHRPFITLFSFLGQVLSWFFHMFSISYVYMWQYDCAGGFRITTNKTGPNCTS